MDWGNHFLDSLEESDIDMLRPHIREVELPRGMILDEPGQTIADVHLPMDCILSIIVVMRDGAQVESRTIGRESGYGLLHALGSQISYELMTVQVPGRAWAIPLERLREAAERSPGLVRCIVHHAQATIIQSAQSAACNSLHSAEQRLARWLLQTEDRLQSGVLPLTQEHLSIMVGVQRTTVTAIASDLQARGLISYVRGKITVSDRPGLQRVACECYAAIEQGTANMLRPKRKAPAA